MRLTFGPWRPDTEDFQGTQTADLSCVLPGPNCYYPAPSQQEISAALPADCVGAVAGVTSSGTFFCFAGTATKLYQLDTSDYTWDDVSRVSGGNYSAAETEPWEFILWEYDGDEVVIATNINDDPQEFTLGASSNFTAVSNAPKARKARIWGSQLVLLSLNGFENAVNGSDINDRTVWSPANTNNAFYQEFLTGGKVVDATNSTTPVILQERAIRRGAIVGLPAKVTFDVIAEGVGSRFPESVATRDERIFWLGEDGFYSISPFEAAPQGIGFGHVNRWFLDRADISDGARVVGQTDPVYPRVYWAYQADQGSVAFDEMLVYDWRLNLWSKCSILAQDLFQYQTPGVALDSLDTLYSGGLDSIPLSLDSRVFRAGAPVLGYVSSDQKIGAFNGENSAAYLVTAEMSGDTRARWRLTESYPVVNADGVTITPQRRDARSDAWQSRSAVAANSAGWHPLRSTGRFHRLRLDIPAGAVWDKVQGIDVAAQVEGQR